MCPCGTSALIWTDSPSTRSLSATETVGCGCEPCDIALPVQRALIGPVAPVEPMYDAPAGKSNQTTSLHSFLCLHSTGNYGSYRLGHGRNDDRCLAISGSRNFLSQLLRIQLDAAFFNLQPPQSMVAAIR